jgi:malonate transporter MadM subunit
MKELTAMLDKNGLVFAFMLVGIVMYLSNIISKRLTNHKIPGAAIAISIGLIIAYFGGEKGLASVPAFSGLALLGGAMMRDFAIVSTAMGASFSEIKKTGLIGLFPYWLLLSAVELVTLWVIQMLRVLQR